LTLYQIHENQILEDFIKLPITLKGIAEAMMLIKYVVNVNTCCVNVAHGVLTGAEGTRTNKNHSVIFSIFSF